MLVGYLKRRDQAHAALTASMVDDYRQDREQMTATLVEVKVALVGLSLRVDHLDGPGSNLHRPLPPR